MKTTFALFLYLNIIFCGSIKAQQAKISFKSKESKGITKANKRLLILWDHVVFNHQNSIMYCDSAIYNRSNNSFIAFNNIKINENDSLNLYGDSLHYYGDQKIAHIYGNVKVITPNISLECPSLIYDQAVKIASYEESALIKNIGSGYNIKSQKGTFNTNTHLLYFKEDVFLNHPDYKILSDTLIYFTQKKKSRIIGETEIKTKNSTIHCHQGWFDNLNNHSSLKGNIFIETKNNKLFADSVYYNENSGLSYAEGNVKIIDDSSQFMIEGYYGFYNENTDSIHVWESAILTQYDSIDTLKIYADQFINNNDSTNKEIFCFNNVVINGTQIKGDCDSIYYNENDSIMEYWTSPIIWMDDSQVTGDFIQFLYCKGIIYKMNVINEGMIITKKDSLHYDQIKGDRIIGSFENNEMYLLNANGSGKVLYYSLNEKDSTINEINQISCEDFDIHLKKNKISKINFIKNPEGKTNPINDIEKDLGTFLENFEIKKRRTYQEKYNSPNAD